eukprot:m51a1_g11913 hypothetical protein (394) ;mRNA; r:643052-644233
MTKAAAVALVALAFLGSASSFIVTQNPGRTQVMRTADRNAVVYADPSCGVEGTRCFVQYSVLGNFGAPWANIHTQEMQRCSGAGCFDGFDGFTANLTMPTGNSVLEFITYCTHNGETVYPDGQGNGGFETATRPRFDVLVADGYTGTLSRTLARGMTRVRYTADALYMPYDGPRPIPGMRCFAWYAFLAKFGDAWLSPRAAEMAFQWSWLSDNGMTHDNYAINITFPEDGSVLEVTSYCEMNGRRVWNTGAHRHYDHEPLAELVQVTPLKLQSKNVVSEVWYGTAQFSFRSKALPLSSIRPASGLRCFASYSFVSSFGGPWRSTVTQEMNVPLTPYGHMHDLPEDLPYERWDLDIAMPPNTKLEATGYCTLNGKTLWVEGQGNFLFQNSASHN